MVIQLMTQERRGEFRHDVVKERSEVYYFNTCFNANILRE